MKNHTKKKAFKKKTCHSPFILFCFCELFRPRLGSQRVGFGCDSFRSAGHTGEPKHRKGSASDIRLICGGPPTNIEKNGRNLCIWFTSSEMFRKSWTIIGETFEFNYSWCIIFLSVNNVPINLPGQEIGASYCNFISMLKILGLGVCM